MNIFVLDYNLVCCAEYHNDKHVVKMILEHAQMLSTACRSTGLDEGYKSTHVNHPCNIWLRESIYNWFWLKELTYWLHEEWRYRFNHPSTKEHKSWQVVQTLSTPKLPDTDITPFVLCMPEEYKSKNVVQSYRQYYIKEKNHIAEWKKRGKPDWYIST